MAQHPPMIRDLGPWPPCWLLYPFRFVDPVSGKWVRAWYVATIKEIEARYARWEGTTYPEMEGIPDVRKRPGAGGAAAEARAITPRAGDFEEDDP